MDKEIGFINESNLIFDDISSEKYRKYTFPNGLSLAITNPMKLNVSKSGGHRIYDDDGWCYYIKPSESWFIKWKVKDNEPNFIK